MNENAFKFPRKFGTKTKRLVRALSFSALGIALATTAFPAAAQESAASLKITHLSPTQRLDESVVLGFGWSLVSNDDDSIVPGGRATLLFSDAEGENFNSDPSCTAKSAPLPKSLCGARVVVQYIFVADGQDDFAASVEAELISVNTLDKNRIDFLVPDPANISNVPAGFSVYSAVITLELNGKRNDPNDPSTLYQTATRPYISAAPALFVDRWGRSKITRSDGSPVTPFNPAKPGERVTVTGTGFGEAQPRSEKSPDLDKWLGSIEGEPFRIASIKKDPSNPGVENLEFVIPKAARGCYQGKCWVKFSQDISQDEFSDEVRVFADLYVRTPTPEVVSFDHTVLGIDHLRVSDSPFGDQFSSSSLVPGSFTTAELSSSPCYGWLGGDFASKFPKPTELCDVKFTFRVQGAQQGFDAPLYGFGGSEAYLQIPLELAGAESGTVSVSVNGKEVSTTEVTYTQMDFIPQGILTLEEKSATYQHVIRPGDELELFGFGLGQTTPETATNSAGGAEHQFPGLEVRISGGELSEPLPVEVLSATKEARIIGEPGSYKWEDFQILSRWSYSGPILRDWVRFKLPSNLNSGDYTLELCQYGVCSFVPSFRVEKEESFGQLCVVVKRNNRFGPSANLSGVVLSDAYGLGSGVTDSSGRMCFESAPTGTRYLVSGQKAGFTFLNRKLSGTITEGTQLAELTAYATGNSKKKVEKKKKSKKKAAGKKKAVKK